MNDLSNLISILLNANSENESIRRDSENQIMEMLNDPPNFLLQLSHVINVSNIQLPVIHLSLILISRMLEPHTLNELKQIQNCFNSNSNLSESLKNVMNTVITSDDITVRNLAANSYALLFQILQDNWIDGLDLIVKSIVQLNPLESLPFLEIFYEITELNVDIYSIFNSEVFLPFFRKILECCIAFIGEDLQNEDVNIDIRLLSAKCVINIFDIVDKNITSSIIDYQLFDEIINSLQNSFSIPDFNLFQCLLQIIEYMVTTGYYFIDNFLGPIFDYSMECFEIPCPENCEATLFLWSRIAHFEFIMKERGNEVKNITENAADAILQICKNIFDDANLPETIDLSSATFSLVLSARNTITDFFKCAPKEVFEIITTKYKIFDSETSPFTTFCALSSITVETQLAPFSDQFLILIQENWENILSLENQVTSEQNLIYDECMVATRILALISIKRLIEALPKFEKVVPLEQTIKKLEDIFTLIKNNQARQKFEHPAILTCYARIIGSICFNKDKKFTLKQMEYVDSNYECLFQYLWSLFDLIYSQYNYLLLEETTESMRILILNACLDIDDNKIFNFLAAFFEYSEEKLNRSNSLFESEEIRYSFQKSLCCFLGCLGEKMAIDNEVCKRSFEALISLINNPNGLIYEEALKSAAMFIPRVNELIDQNTVILLVTNALDSLNSESVQMIISASYLLVEMFLYIPDRILEALPDIFDSLQRVILNHPEFRECNIYLLKALSTMFEKINPQYTFDFKDEFLSLIINIEPLIGTLTLKTQYDIEFVNLFYTLLSNCYLAYVNNFLTNLPDGPCSNEIIIEGKKNLDHLLTFASYLFYIPNANKTDDLLLAYINLVEAITKKTHRKNVRFLHKPLIKDPIIEAINRFSQTDIEKLKIVKKLKREMENI